MNDINMKYNKMLILNENIVGEADAKGGTERRKESN